METDEIEKPASFVKSFEPTYKEWKPNSGKRSRNFSYCFEPTYKEWKLGGLIGGGVSTQLWKL
ncbi:hypothetical protein TDIS_2159 [Thermosulfurimonas dismutans]|uniref:Uncharacterized protein n=1 Tax=Thermosulfurimonas dismutans TaxID=999894 RepID=A0A179D210_9BACT|nr:hypothetical protein TDIS_2159 [Thermosulfurimonas dismutans]